MAKQVTFRADGRVLRYSPGKVYTEELNPLLETLLRKGTILILIDPLTLDDPAPVPAPVAPVIVKVEPKPEPTEQRKYSAPAPKPAEKAKDAEKDDEESEV